MEEKKLTAEEIVKKLNYIKEQYLSYIYNDDDECKVLFVDDILDLIHRLQDENEELKSPKFASWKLKFFRLKEEFDKELAEHEEFTKKAKAEIERLTEAKEDLYFQNQNLQTYIDNHEPIWKRNTEQAVKDTAKEIFTDLLNEFSKRKSCGNADVVVREMASRKGVEVE